LAKEHERAVRSLCRQEMVCYPGGPARDPFAFEGAGRGLVELWEMSVGLRASHQGIRKLAVHERDRCPVAARPEEPLCQEGVDEVRGRFQRQGLAGSRESSKMHGRSKHRGQLERAPIIDGAACLYLLDAAGPHLYQRARFWGNVSVELKPRLAWDQ
jgi:hypothetical protein